MNESQTSTRLTGIAGIVAALCWTIGDALLLGARATAEDYPILAKYAGSTDFSARVVGPALLLGIGYSIAPFVHGSFYYIAEMVKLLPLFDPPAQTHVLEAATRATTVLFGTYAVLVLVTLAGFVWMTVTMARGRSLYPRRAAIANPIVLMAIGSLLDRVLPDPLSRWLGGAGLNLGMLFFFTLSLAILWKEREPRVLAGTRSAARFAQ